VWRGVRWRVRRVWRGVHRVWRGARRRVRRVWRQIRLRKWKNLLAEPKSFLVTLLGSRQKSGLSSLFLPREMRAFFRRSQCKNLQSLDQLPVLAGSIDKQDQKNLHGPWSSQDLPPLDIAARASGDNDLVMEKVGSILPSYNFKIGNQTFWSAAFNPCRMNPGGWSQVGSNGVLRLSRLNPKWQKKSRFNRFLAQARNRVAVDLTNFQASSEDTARLIVDLSAVGAPIVCAELNSEVVIRIGKDLSELIPTRIGKLVDPLNREIYSSQLRRFAHRDHSIQANLAKIVRETGRSSIMPTVSIVLATQRPRLVEFALAQIAEQSYPHLEVVVGCHGFELEKSLVASSHQSLGNLKILSCSREKNLGEVLSELVDHADGDLISKWDDDDWYDVDHILDLVLAMRYSDAEIVGKAAEFIYSELLDLTMRRFSVGAENFSTTIAGGTILTSREVIADVLGGWPSAPRRVDRLLINEVLKAGGLCYRTHGFGYILRRGVDPMAHTWDQGIGYFLSASVAQRAGLDLEFAGFGDAVRYEG
ncbi:MAG: glycosyltransferase, partial [Actinomycetes bacterium]